MPYVQSYSRRILNFIIGLLNFVYCFFWRCLDSYFHRLPCYFIMLTRCHWIQCLKSLWIIFNCKYFDIIFAFHSPCLGMMQFWCIYVLLELSRITLFYSTFVNEINRFALFTVLLVAPFPKEKAIKENNAFFSNICVHTETHTTQQTQSIWASLPLSFSLSWELRKLSWGINCSLLPIFMSISTWFSHSSSNPHMFVAFLPCLTTFSTKWKRKSWAN